MASVNSPERAVAVSVTTHVPDAKYPDICTVSIDQSREISGCIGLLPRKHLGNTDSGRKLQEPVLIVTGPLRKRGPRSSLRRKPESMHS